MCKAHIVVRGFIAAARPIGHARISQAHGLRIIPTIQLRRGPAATSRKCASLAE